jgi:hypothetical protein
MSADAAVVKLLCDVVDSTTLLIFYLQFDDMLPTLFTQ